MREASCETHVVDFRWDSWTGTCNKWEKFSSFEYVLKENEKNTWKKSGKTCRKIPATWINFPNFLKRVTRPFFRKWPLRNYYLGARVLVRQWSFRNLENKIAQKVPGPIFVIFDRKSVPFVFTKTTQPKMEQARLPPFASKAPQEAMLENIRGNFQFSHLR